MVTALLAASSQPLIAWSMAGLSGAFLENDLIYAAVFRNILILLLALFIAWFADNSKANLLLDSEFELRRQVFDSIYAMPIDEFEKKDSGAYYNQIGRDTQILSKELFEGTLKIIVNGLSIGLIAVLLLYCHWMSFLIILIFLLPLTINNLLMPQRIAACQERSMQTLVGMTVKIKDLLSGFFTARFQEGEKQVSESMYTHFAAAAAAEKQIMKLANLSGLIANASVTLSQFSGLFAAFYLMRLGKIDFPQFVLIFQLGMIVSEPVISLINAVISVRSSRPYIENTEKILAGYKCREDFRLDKVCSIRLDDVSFVYPEKQRSVLDHFNYCFEQGRKYLIVGESGSGKTTLIKLLLGTLHPSSGHIYYDRIDQQELSPSEIYHHSAVVPQQVYIFDDTIRRNLDLKGNCTDEELLAVISKVKLDKFFAANGYTLDTRISNETLQVSGGEKARIGLARSLTLPKSIVIYDEVLSGLDPQNAELIEDLLLADDKRIVIHIAHNSSPGYQDRYDAVVRLAIRNEETSPAVR
jgi:ABC-type multidrug transport system fused ATPase/permease subunit